MTLAPLAVLPLTEVGGNDRGSVGGKAAMLGELRRRGLSVPDGVVLTAAVHRAHGAGPDRTGVPDELMDALDAARVRFGGRVAVRSSALDEDTPGTSAAGRYATVLDVADRQGLLAAVRTCWASADPTGSAMAVLIQPMVPATAAGVAFTADPITGERDVVVVVAGRPGAVTEGGSGQQWRFRPGPHQATAPGQPAAPTESAAAGTTGMTPQLVRSVARVALGAAMAVGGPADVEWAVGEGRVTLLQARPMTALPDPVRWEAPLPGGWLRNFRLGEWLPGPVSPLFETWLVELLESGVRARAAREAGLVMRPPLHVTVGGWYFHAPLGADPMRTLLGALIRNPRFAAGSVLVRRRPEWTERLVVRRYAGGWRRSVLPDQHAATERLRRLVEHSEPTEVTGPAEVAGLVEAIEAVADRAAAVLWSLSMVGGFAWKLEAVLRGLLGRRLPAAEVEALVCWSTRPPGPASGPWPRSCVQSLDWIHPPVQLEGPAAARADARSRPETAVARAALGGRRWRRVERLAGLARRYAALREEQAIALTLPWPQLRSAVLRLGAVAAEAGALTDPADVWFLHRDELATALGTELGAGSGGVVRAGEGQLPAAGDVDERRRRWQARHRLTPPLQLGSLPRPVAALLPDAPVPAAGALVTGQPGSAGRASGRVVQAADLDAAARLAAGEVLVTPLVTPAWLPVVARAAAVVTDGGTIAAHAALVCRELGVPLVLAAGDATRRLLDGEMVTVDGALGTVTAGR